jgi:hypothetical protein
LPMVSRSDTRPKRRANATLTCGVPVAGRVGRELGKAEADDQSTQAGSQDGPEDPGVAGSRIGAIDEQRLRPPDARVEGHRSQSAKPAGKDGECQEPLLLVGQTPD